MDSPKINQKSAPASILINKYYLWESKIDTHLAEILAFILSHEISNIHSFSLSFILYTDLLQINQQSAFILANFWKIIKYFHVKYFHVHVFSWINYYLDSIALWVCLTRLWNSVWIEQDPATLKYFYAFQQYSATYKERNESIRPHKSTRQETIRSIIIRKHVKA